MEPVGAAAALTLERERLSGSRNFATCSSLASRTVTRRTLLTIAAGLAFVQVVNISVIMVTIGLSIVIADLLIWYYGAQVHQMEPPALLAEPFRGLPVRIRPGTTVVT